MIKQQKAAMFLYTYYKSFYAAIVYHRTHNNRNITLQHYKYMKNIYLDKNNYIVVKKGTQAGCSEWLIVNSIIKAMDGRNILYVLPTFELKNRFVKNRIDRTLEYTSVYNSIMKQKSAGKQAESTSLKHIGSGSIAFVGSNTPVSFVEFPASDIIIDELDLCNQELLNMAQERLSACIDPTQIKVGNPTINDYGIDWEYNQSNQNQWFLQCGHCNHWFNPDFFINVVQKVNDSDYMILDKNYERNNQWDINLICEKCKRAVDRFENGEWVKKNKHSHISGYQINKLFATNMKIKDILQRFEEGLKNDSKLQRFYNGDLGLAFTAAGAKISVDMLNDCKLDGYNMPDASKGPCVMGIDIGDRLHVRIDEILPENKLKAVYIGTVQEYEDIKDLYKRYSVKIGCVDALPEKRLSKKIVAKLKGMFMCYEIDSLTKDIIDIKNKIIKVDRTATLDAVKESIFDQSLILPQNADKIMPLDKKSLSEYYANMIAATRVYVEKSGTYRWLEGNIPDHYFHAENFKLIAKKILSKVI